MSDTVNLLNQLLRAAVEDPALAARLPFQPDLVEVTPDGARVEGTLAHAQARGRVALDLGVVDQGGGRFAVSLAAREAPAQLGPLLEPFRGVLEQLEAELRLNFDEAGER